MNCGRLQKITIWRVNEHNLLLIVHCGAASFRSAEIQGRWSTRAMMLLLLLLNLQFCFIKSLYTNRISYYVVSKPVTCDLGGGKGTDLWIPEEKQTQETGGRDHRDQKPDCKDFYWQHANVHWWKACWPYGTAMHSWFVMLSGLGYEHRKKQTREYINQKQIHKTRVPLGTFCSNAKQAISTVVKHLKETQRPYISIALANRVQTKVPVSVSSGLLVYLFCSLAAPWI